jgi:tRNA dimethylallyltransferase
MSKKLFIVSGATATGKSRLAQALAFISSAHIISVDSMKLYRGMDIGTDKPSPEIRKKIPHHLIDVAEPTETYNVARYVEEASAVIERLMSEKVSFLLEGGTPLFIKALVEGLFEGVPADLTLRRRLYEEAGRSGTASLHKRLEEVDPISAQRIHSNDLKRIVRALEVYETVGCPISLLQRQFGKTRRDYFLLVLWRDRGELRERIHTRIRQMLDNGFVEEVRNLVIGRGGLGSTAVQAAGYAEVKAYLDGGLDFVQMVRRIEKRHWQLARRQMVWLKRFPKVCHICLRGDPDYESLAKELFSLYAGGTSLLFS